MSEFEFKGTPGPWYLVADDGADFTAIATKPQIDGDLDLDCEVLGSSEWLRAESKDLQMMAAAPKMFNALLFGLENLEYGSDIEEFKKVAIAALKDATGGKTHD